MTSLPVSIASASSPITEIPTDNIQKYDATITFPDVNLESAIRNALSNPVGGLTASNLSLLTKLDAFGKGISDLTNIQYCGNLTYLDLRQNQITDISPLSQLTKLTKLYLRDNHIVDISPISTLTNLTEITLWNNQITDISPVSNLTNLTQLYLSENQISDISSLFKLTNLTILYLSGNLINNVSSLRSLVRLAELRVDNNQISDISPIVNNSGLAKGDQLWLQGNYLDLQEGSVVYKGITTLEKRGVNVQPAINPLADRTKSDNSFWSTVWWIFGVVVVLGVLLFGARGLRSSRGSHVDTEERHGNDETEIYVHQKRRCPRCEGTGKVDPPPINRVFGIKWTCKKCGGSGWIWD